MKNVNNTYQDDGPALRTPLFINPNFDNCVRHLMFNLPTQCLIVSIIRADILNGNGPWFPLYVAMLAILVVLVGSAFYVSQGVGFYFIDLIEGTFKQRMLRALKWFGVFSVVILCVEWVVVQAGVLLSELWLAWL